MRKAIIGVVLVGLFLGPASCLVALGLVLDPAAKASCLPSSSSISVRTAGSVIPSSTR